MCVCVCACVRACVRACVCVCVFVCLCASVCAFLTLYNRGNRSYKRKTELGKYEDGHLGKALRVVRQGIPLVNASKQFGVRARTLRRHRDNAVAFHGTLKLGPATYKHIPPTTYHPH